STTTPSPCGSGTRWRSSGSRSPSSCRPCASNSAKRRNQASTGMDDERTWYEVLGVETRAAKGDIKVAYQEALDAATGANDGDEAAQVRRAWRVRGAPGRPQPHDESIGAPLPALEPVTSNGDGHPDADDDVDDEYD